MKLIVLLSLILFINSAQAWQKIDGSGQAVPARSGPWSCVAQGDLLWEVKGLTDDYLHYKNTYSWYQQERGTANRGSCQNVNQFIGCDTQDLIDHLNTTNRCGRSNWRLPTVAELTGLLDDATTPGGPLINSYLFPRTVQGPYWTQTMAQREPLVVNFKDGQVYPLGSNRPAWLRLVSSAQE
ncbi:Lcl C-terminal domain-containing protein [Salinibius halmophilus]|uniref:Lcl C-terminal domain-containing protein n=1 Tax=Salinibius halmophilus TaxID=1853216 RepID=UPI000E672A6F|nr:DUF1566 domain-containing protein [Salinibius halmophilus]